MTCRILSRVACACALVLLMAVPLSQHAVAASPAPGSAGAPSVPGLGPFDVLNGVSARTAKDAWAVGWHQVSVNRLGHRTLVEHWDGAAWSIVSSPSSRFTELKDVSADSATDAWAIGKTWQGNDAKTFVIHWDGTVWTISPSPSPSPTLNSLESVFARTPTDVWAVGEWLDSNGSSRTLIEHWDGTAWSQVASPDPVAGGDAELHGVSGISGNDVWAVGWSGAQTLTEHWNGTSWSQVKSPNHKKRTSWNGLSGVTMVSATDVWAVGMFCPDCGLSPNPEGTITEHWNGSSWTIANGSGDGMLVDVGAHSATDIWALGNNYGGASDAGVIRHRDGASWTEVPHPFTNGKLTSVGVVSSKLAWVVGDQNAQNPLVWRWNGTTWSAM